MNLDTLLLILAACIVGGYLYLAVFLEGRRGSKGGES